MLFKKTAIPQELISLFLEKGTERNYAPKEILIKEGEPTPYGFYLKKGALRYSCVSQEGKEITRIILMAPDLPLAFHFDNKQFNQTPSFYSVETLNETVLQIIPWTEISTLLKKNVDVALFFLHKWEEIYFYREKSLQDHQMKEATERYLEFLLDYQDILPSLNNKIIATYLNISPESLSRLKKNL